MIVSQTHEFWREAEILSKLHHPNVVAFYGVVQDGPGGTLATVTEFMVNGSLRHVLLRKDKCVLAGFLHLNFYYFLSFYSLRHVFLPKDCLPVFTFELPFPPLYCQ